MIALADRVLVGTYAKPPIMFTSGKGMYMYDSNGEKYLDFTAGIAVNALGHSDPQWAEVVAKQV
jgi:acetylornithine aminotransferase